MNITKEKELTFKDGKIVILKLTNKNNIDVLLSNYGATILSILVPGKNGNKMDITLGYKCIEDYLNNHNTKEKYYFGCTVGRYANRIANGHFKIGKIKFDLSKNEGENHLHGGFFGLNKKVWGYKLIESNNEVIFNYKSNDNEEGYPGNLDIELSISLNDLNEIKLSYKATTDKPTPVNLTNHVYFNLNGGNRDILNHNIKLKSDFILENDENNIPTGKFIPVAKTEYDFNTTKNLTDSTIMQMGGFDNCFVLNKTNKELELAGNISKLNNSVSVEIHTTEPSLQLYTANAFDGSFIGKENKIYKKHFGVCLEAQNLPDSPNHINFPNSIIYPDDIYEQVTIYKIKNN